MYFPSGPAEILATSRSTDDSAITLVPNKRSTLFVVLKRKSFELWSIRVSREYSLMCLGLRLGLIYCCSCAANDTPGTGRTVYELVEQVWGERLARMGSGWVFLGRPGQSEALIRLL